tara:strand:- start:355 stop:1074 length:720 start_codon:yes stop_codon:yes gene_type:complete
MPIVTARDVSNNKNRPLEMNGSKLVVKDQAVADALGGTIVVDGSAVTQPVSGTFYQATQPVSAASLPLPSGAATASNQATANGNLASLVAALDSGGSVLDVKIASDASGGATAANQATANGSLASIDTALSGTITTSQGVSRTNASLKSAASVTAGDVTTAIDANLYKQIAIYGNSSDNAQQLTIQVSNDSVTWYDADANVYANGASGDYYHKFDACARYARVKYGSTATESTAYSMLA